MIGLFALLAGLYSIVVPPFETPDEIWHYAFIQHLASGKGLPVSQPNTPALWRQQGVQAPGYYLAAAALTAAISQDDFPAIYGRANPHAAIGQPDATTNRNYLIHHADEGWPWRGSILALHLARLFSVLLGAVTLWATYRALALITDPRWALLGTALVGFIPQFVFISAAASNDNAINALAALVLWRLVALIVAPPEPRYSRKAFGSALVLGCLLGLALLSKLSALALVALTGLTLLLAAWRARSWRALIGNGLAVGLPALAIAGWWYGRNWVLYRDPLAWNVWQANILLRVIPAGWGTIIAELGSLERSFWGLFGWLNVPYPAWVYGAFRVLEIGLALGLLLHVARWLISLARRNRPPFDWRWAGGWLLILWLGLLAFSWVRFMRIAPAAQGRYFFPAAPSLALLLILALGGYRLLGLTARATRRAGWGIAAALVLLSAVTPFWIIRPAYRPPPPAEDAQVTAVRAELGNQLAILGVSAEPAQLMPGETASVTVVWQALTPMRDDYSVFVHLVNEEGLTIAQADTMPGGGLLPTSQWTPGQTRAERYAVTIPTAAYTPDRGRWVVGMYDHKTGQRLPLRLVNAAPGLAVAADADGLRFGGGGGRGPARRDPQPHRRRLRGQHHAGGVQLQQPQFGRGRAVHGHALLAGAGAGDGRLHYLRPSAGCRVRHRGRPRRRAAAAHGDVAARPDHNRHARVHRFARGRAGLLPDRGQPLHAARLRPPGPAAYPRRRRRGSPAVGARTGSRKVRARHRAGSQGDSQACPP